MTPDRWQKLKHIFEVALEADPSDRARIITEQCAGDSELEAEATNLINNHVPDSMMFSPVVPPVPPSSHHQSLPDGTLVANRYRIRQLVGRGGMGEVYEAEDTRVGEIVALKAILTGGATLPDAIARFIGELRVARRVSHRNVCRVHDIVIEQLDGAERVFYTMELLRGETLGERLRRDGPLNAEALAEISEQLASGLDAIHKAGIVHRDFKSANVFLEQTGDGVRAVITDFGLARIDSSSGQSTALIGTPDYMAPEVLEGAKPSFASDIYAFGVVMYEGVTGQTPFQATSPFLAALQRLRQPAPSPRLLAPGLDDRSEATILRCLERDPQQRFASAGEAVAVLKGEKRLPRLAGRPRARTKALAIAVVMLVGLAASFWISRERYYQPTDEAAVWFEKAMRARNSGDYFTAAKQLERAVSVDDRFAVAHAMLADCYMAQDYGERAREAMLRASARASVTPVAEDDRARIQAIELTLLREYREAAQKYEALAKQAPAERRRAARMDVGRSLEQADQTKLAIAVYRDLAQTNPADGAARVRLAILLSRSGDNAGAEENFTRAIEIYEADGNLPGIAEASLHQSRAFISANRIENGEKLLRRAMDVASAAQSPWLRIRAVLQLGVAARKRGAAAEAREYAMEGIQLAREHDMDYAATSGMLDLGNTFLQHREYDDAQKWFETALGVARDHKDQRNEARALASLASLRLTQHRAAEASSYIAQALDYYSRGNYRRETATVMILAAFAREQNGDVKGAEEVLKKNAELARSASGDPEQVREAYSRLATLQVRREEYPAALETYRMAESAAATKTPDGVVLVNRALAQWRLGLAEDATESITAAAKVSDSQKNIRARVRWVMAAMYLGKGKGRLAVDELKRSLAELPETAQAERMEASALMGLAMQSIGQASGWSMCKKAAEWADASGDAQMAASLHLIAARGALKGGLRDVAARHIAVAKLAAARLGRLETEWRACHLEAKLNGSGDCELYGSRLKQSWGDAHFERVLALAPPGDIHRL